MSLRWSAWMPLMAAHPLALGQLPFQPGFYRVRRADRPRTLIWIGWAGQGVRESMERLSRQVHLPVRPFDDPQSPALVLWTLHRAEHASFEVSGAAAPEDGEGWRLLESLREAYRSAAPRLEGR